MECEAEAGEALRLATKADLGVGCMGEGRQAENRSQVSGLMTERGHSWQMRTHEVEHQ